MMISKKIPSCLTDISEFVSAYRKKLKGLSIDEKDIFDTSLCLQEALANAVKHGHKFNPRLSVDVKVSLRSGSLAIEVKDQGEGFDAEKVANPTKDAHLTKTSGRGVYLMKTLMDEVEYFDSGRGLRMKKMLKKEAPREDQRRKKK